MSEPAPQVLHLARAERRQIAVAPGTVILVRQGTITLREPLAWLAEACLRVEHRLTAETAHTVATGGWAELTALESAEVALIPAQSPQWGQRLWRHRGAKEAA